MSEDTVAGVREAVDAVYRADSRRVLATLIRLLGDFDLAEEAMHQAFAAALEQWERDGVPENPRAWLVTAGRFKAIDRMRRRARFDAASGELAGSLRLRRGRSSPLPTEARSRTNTRGSRGGSFSDRTVERTGHRTPLLSSRGVKLGSHGRAFRRRPMGSSVAA